MNFYDMERLAYVSGNVKMACLLATLADLDTEVEGYPDELGAAQTEGYKEGKRDGENADLAEIIRLKDMEIEELQRVNDSLTEHFKIIYTWFSQNMLKTVHLRKDCADKLRQSVRQFGVWL